MAESEYIQITHRELSYSTFDVDNHLYENRDALTKFVPREYDGVIKYVDVEGRTKLAIGDRISDFFPNPTFARVAVPGGSGFDVTRGGRPGAFGSPSGGLTEKPVAMPGVGAFSILSPGWS